MDRKKIKSKSKLLPLIVVCNTSSSKSNEINAIILHQLLDQNIFLIFASKGCLSILAYGAQLQRMKCYRSLLSELIHGNIRSNKKKKLIPSLSKNRSK